MTRNMLKVGLIDNDIIMRVGVMLLLKDHYAEIKTMEADHTAAFVRLHFSSPPDFLILGNKYTTKKDCMSSVLKLREHFPATPLIVYNELPTPNMTIPYFEIGVNGYLLKQHVGTHILNCIKTIEKKERYLCPSLAQMLLERLINTRQPKGRPLTRREMEIADYLKQGKSTSWIAHTLDRKPSTISTIKQNIFKKMQVENVIELSKVLSMDIA